MERVTSKKNVLERCSMGLPSTIGSQFHSTQGVKYIQTPLWNRFLFEKVSSTQQFVKQSLKIYLLTQKQSNLPIFRQFINAKTKQKVWLRLIYQVTSNLSYKQLTEDRGKRVSISIAQPVLFPSPSRFIHGKLQLLIRHFCLLLSLHPRISLHPRRTSISYKTSPSSFAAQRVHLHLANANFNCL